MVLLILESLGSTELVFILIMALVFFGPRKLPQISRSLGKNLAEFRRASEDFKRTWDREVSMEDGAVTGSSSNLAEHNSILDIETTQPPMQSPSISAIAPDQVIARQTIASASLDSSDKTDLAPDQSDFESLADEPKHSPKNDWL